MGDNVDRHSSIAMKPNYRFKCEVVDEETGEVIASGSTFLSSHITEFGECESVDQEVGEVLRYFRKKGKEEYEAKNYPDLCK